MSHNKYERSFIVLAPESGGYALEGRKLSGTALLEIKGGKGKMTVNVFGLKTLSAAVYKLYIIASGEHNALGVPCGIVTPDDKGKFSRVWEFDPLNVGGCGTAHDRFDVVAVVAKSVEGAQNEFVTPLVGYKNGAVIWKSGFREFQPGDTGRVIKNESPEAVPLIPLDNDDSYPVYEAELEHVAAPSKDSAIDEIIRGTYLSGERVQCEECVSEAEHSEDACVTEATQTNNHHNLAFEPAPPEEGEAGDDATIKSIITGSFHSEGEKPYHYFSERLKPALAAHFEKAEPVFGKLETDAPKEVFAKLINAINAVLDYLPADGAGTVAGLLSEIEGGYALSPRKLIEVLAEYSPGKVMESLAEALTGVVPYLDGWPGLCEVVIKCCGYIRHTEERNGKTWRESGLDGGVELREPEPDEDHSARFKEKLRDFSERSDRLDGEVFTPPDEETPEEHATETTKADSGVEAEASGGRRGEHREERGDGRRGERRDDRREEHGGHFDEKNLLPLFDKGERLFRFPGQKHGDGFPPPVPPVIPIYDIRWIRITERDFGLLPPASLKYVTNPFAVRSYRKYRHLILGVTGAGRRAFYVGVPGTYSEKGRATAFSLGYTGFVPLGGGRPRDGEFGYWVAEL